MDGRKLKEKQIILIGRDRVVAQLPPIQGQQKTIQLEVRDQLMISDALTHL